MLKFNSTIQIRLFISFVSTIATMTVLPYLIIYLSEYVGTVVTGLLFLAVMLVNLLGSVLGGYISDRIGRKKMILISEFILIIGYLGAAFANSPWGIFPYVTFSFYLIIQFFTGFASPVYQALIVDVSTVEERRDIYTFSYWLRNLGIGIGSIIGAFLFSNYLFYLFLGVAFTSLCSFIITYFFIKETYSTANFEGRKQVNPKFLKTYVQILSQRFFMIFCTASLLIVAVEEQLTNYIGVRLANKIDDEVQLLPFLSLEIDGVNLLGILKAENTILIFCFTVLITQYVKRWKDRNVLLVGLILFFGGYMVISISISPIILILAMFISTMGEMIYVPVQQTLLSKMIPDHARSTYMAMYSIAIILGVSFAGIFMIMSAWLSPIVITSCIGFMAVLSIFLFLIFTSSNPTRLIEKENN